MNGYEFKSVKLHDDPRPATEALMRILAGSCFVGKDEIMGEFGPSPTEVSPAIRTTLVFDKPGWGILGLALAESPLTGVSLEAREETDDPFPGLEAFEGKTVTWAGPGLTTGRRDCLVIVFDLSSMALALVGTLAVMKSVREGE